MVEGKWQMANGGKWPWRHLRFTLCLLPFAMPFVGCAPLATQQDVLKLDDDLNHLRKNQADLVAKMTDLSGNLESLNSQLDSSQQRMSALSQKLDDLQADLNHRFSVLSGQVTGTSTQGASTPGDLYRLAYNDYQAGKFDLALVGFRNFMSQYPHVDLSAQAQFYIGECEFALKNWADAAAEYNKVVLLFPKTDYEPKALYKRGLALQQIGRTDDAVECFKRLLKEHPHHELAKSAHDILQESQ
jgi:tol-pal system protein YbgF